MFEFAVIGLREAVTGCCSVSSCDKGSSREFIYGNENLWLKFYSLNNVIHELVIFIKIIVSAS